jgi:hypothetical protein
MSATSHIGEHKKSYLAGGLVAVACLVLLGGRTGGTTSATLANSSEEQYCKWVFGTYEASFYELEWFKLVSNGGVNDNVCSVIAEPHHQSFIADLMARVTELVQGLDQAVRWSEQDTAFPGPGHPSDKLFSRFYYRRVCFSEDDGVWYKAPGKGVQLIEPLFGMLRDPYDNWCPLEQQLSPKPVSYENPVPFESTEHILPQGFAPYGYTLEDGGEISSWRSHGRPPWHSNHHPIEMPDSRYSYSPPRNLLVDLGANPFTSSPNAGIWFYERYHARGQPFDSVIAATSDDHTKFPDMGAAYEGIPEEMLGIYNVLGVPISLENDRTNLVDLIRRIARPQDNLVLKLHGMSRSFSQAFAQRLARWEDDPARGGISGLIDEFYFEHRVNFKPLAGIWGFGGGEDPLEAGSLATSYKLFMDLRSKGIRAHSWP